MNWKDEKRNCAVCGAEFAPTRPAKKYCSAKCAREANQRRWRLRGETREERELEHARAKSRPVSNYELMHARTKPANTSEVRWRMELRRRANARLYAEFGEVLSR